MKTPSAAGLGLLALVTIALVGCEAAEESAQKLQEKAEQAVQEIAREAVSDSIQAFNKQVDEIQQSAEEHFSLPKDDETTDKPKRETEVPAELGEEGIEA